MEGPDQLMGGPQRSRNMGALVQKAARALGMPCVVGLLSMRVAMIVVPDKTLLAAVFGRGA